MNKKNLSVVMAGAMLATSVAPVLADTTEVKKYEISENQLGLLKSGLRNFMDSKKFVSTDLNSDLAGESIYGITTTNTLPAANSTGSDLDTVVPGSLSAGNKIYVWDLGHREENGKYYSTSNGEISQEAEKYTAASLEAAYKTIYDTKSNAIKSAYENIVKDVEFDAEAGVMTVTFLSVDSNFKNITAEYKVGDVKADLTKVVSKDGVEYAIGDVQKTSASGKLLTSQVAGFATSKNSNVAAGADIEGKKIAEITIVADAKNELLVSDLYNGTMLTDKGYEILAGLKDSYDLSGSGAATGIKVYKADGTENNLTCNAGVLAQDVPTYLQANQDTGIVTMEISYTDEYGTKHEYTVRGTNEADAQTLATWLATQDPTVDVLGGATRYETAVAIAKETFGNTFKLVGTDGASDANDVVLVNGSALVDGLAAAPYAKVLGNDGAPILLSETDSLPTATKDYLKKITEKVAPADMHEITIHLVGGESVLSDSVKKELKDMGFTVKRVAGDNREETSIAVAKAIKAENPTLAGSNAFVVGSNGEADAMSIASVASDKSLTVNTETGKVRPIIVSSVHGLSEDAVEYLADYTTTVVGGTAQISNEEYKAINDANKAGNKATRIAGSNRQATNAAVIKEYYSTVTGKPVVLAKDGQSNKSELVDALAASTLASKLGAPIVLGTNKLSDAQINEIELTSSNNATAIYQVGKGVSEDIIKTLVNTFLK